MAGGGCEETAHVSGHDGWSRESCASRQHGSQESQTDVMSFFCRKAGNVFVIDLWVRKDATSRKGCRVFTGGPESSLRNR